MAAVDALSMSGQNVGTTPNAFSSLSSESFVKIIFAELGHQDPLAPSDSKALLDQLSSLRTIQSSVDMSNRIGALVAQNELSNASALIGKEVTGITDGFERVRGFVQSVSRTIDGAVLNLADGTRVRMVNVDEVIGEPLPEGAAS